MVEDTAADAILVLCQTLLPARQSEWRIMEISGSCLSRFESQQRRPNLCKSSPANHHTVHHQFGDMGRKMEMEVQLHVDGTLRQFIGDSEDSEGVIGGWQGLVRLNGRHNGRCLGRDRAEEEAAEWATLPPVVVSQQLPPLQFHCLMLNTQHCWWGLCLRKISKLMYPCLQIIVASISSVKWAHRWNPSVNGSNSTDQSKDPTTVVVPLITKGQSGVENLQQEGNFITKSPTHRAREKTDGVCATHAGENQTQEVI